nr:LysM peptidoglycan-binding domain-containing protein [Streptomyces sparsogenes]
MPTPTAALSGSSCPSSAPRCIGDPANPANQQPTPYPPTERIAASRLGDGARWREIAKLNQLRDADALTPGQKLKLPKK